VLLGFRGVRKRLSRIPLLSLRAGRGVAFTIQGTAKQVNEEGQFRRVRFGADVFCDESPIIVFEVQGHWGPPLLRVIKVIWGPEAGLSISAHFDEGFLMIPIKAKYRIAGLKTALLKK
jgi:hypothetical protein